jgi:predicted NBD/HSP70 family sugar kinase
VKTPVVVGIDLGGTNVRLAVVNSQGEILSRQEWTTASMGDQATLVSTLAGYLAKAAEAARARDWEIRGGFFPGKVGWSFPPTSRP